MRKDVKAIINKREDDHGTLCEMLNDYLFEVMSPLSPEAVAQWHYSMNERQFSEKPEEDESTLKEEFRAKQDFQISAPAQRPDHIPQYDGQPQKKKHGQYDFKITFTDTRREVVISIDSSKNASFSLFGMKDKIQIEYGTYDIVRTPEFKRLKSDSVDFEGLCPEEAAAKILLYLESFEETLCLFLHAHRRGVGVTKEHNQSAKFSVSPKAHEF